MEYLRSLRKQLATKSCTMPALHEGGALIYLRQDLLYQQHEGVPPFNIQLIQLSFSTYAAQNRSILSDRE